jgi:hypothetical protein
MSDLIIRGTTEAEKAGYDRSVWHWNSEISALPIIANIDTGIILIGMRPQRPDIMALSTPKEYREARVVLWKVENVIVEHGTVLH